MTNRVVNPVLRRVLQTPLGRGLGRSLASGTPATGRGRRTSWSAGTCGTGTGWILVGQAQRTTWWRNHRSPAPVELWPAGRPARACDRAAIVGAERPGECGGGRATLLRGGAEVAAAAVSDVVMVRVDLGGG